VEFFAEECQKVREVEFLGTFGQHLFYYFRVGLPTWSTHTHTHTHKHILSVISILVDLCGPHSWNKTEINQKDKFRLESTKLFHFSRRTIGEIEHRNISGVGGVRTQITAGLEQPKRFTAVLAFLLQCFVI